MSTQQTQTQTTGRAPVIRYARPAGRGTEYRVTADGARIGYVYRNGDGDGWEAQTTTAAAADIITPAPIIGSHYRTRADAAAALVSAAAEHAASAVAGELRLSVVREATDPDGRTRYGYGITEEASSATLATGSDITTGAGGDDGPAVMLGTLATYVAAAAESYRYAGWRGENSNLFPRPVVTRADGDALSMLILECDPGMWDAEAPTDAIPYGSADRWE